MNFTVTWKQIQMERKQLITFLQHLQGITTLFQSTFCIYVEIPRVQHGDILYILQEKMEGLRVDLMKLS